MLLVTTSKALVTSSDALVPSFEFLEVECLLRSGWYCVSGYVGTAQRLCSSNATCGVVVPWKEVG